MKLKHAMVLFENLVNHLVPYCRDDVCLVLNRNYNQAIATTHYGKRNGIRKFIIEINPYAIMANDYIYVKYVLIHELAHVFSAGWGHGGHGQFWQLIFGDFLDIYGFNLRYCTCKLNEEIDGIPFNDVSYRKGGKKFLNKKEIFETINNRLNKFAFLSFKCYIKNRVL